MATTTVPPSALILIDLQNEFLTPQGNFTLPNAESLLSNIARLVARFRARENSHIIWIRATYPPHNSGNTSFDVLNGRHTGKKPCCQEGMPGADFPLMVSQLIEPDTDVVLTKTWYSAFKETRLEEMLRERGAEEVYFAGLMSNVCVLSTVTQAMRLGFKTYVIEECMGYARLASHERALRTMQDLGAHIVPDVASLESSASSGDTLVPTLYYVNGSIPSWRVMMALYEKGITFEAIRRKVMTIPKETREPDFIALNHRGKTPVFVDPVPPGRPVIVNESLAILQYIETYHNPAVPLLPSLANRASRALVLSRVQETENLHNAYDELEDAHYEKGILVGPLTDEDRIQFMTDIFAELDYWEVYASRTRYIAGDEFSLADCAFFPLLAYMVHRGFEWRRPNFVDYELVSTVENAWPSLRRYFQRVWERGGKDGCAQRAQPDGWDRPGRTNVWKLTVSRKI